LFIISESILTEAQDLAKQMIESGDEYRLIRSRGGAEIACVSRNEAVLFPLVSFQEGEVTFYVGHRRPVR